LAAEVDVTDTIGGTRPCRISARAVLSGGAVAVAVFGVLAELVGALGFFPTTMDARGAETMMAGVGAWAAAWMASVLVAGFVASTIARAATVRDGVLHGVVTWAVLCTLASALFWPTFLGAVALGLASGDFVSTMLTRDVLVAGFGYDVAAIGFSALGGFLGARTEAREAHEVPIRHIRPRSP
jgi:hypothetical protein